MIGKTGKVLLGVVAVCLTGSIHAEQYAFVGARANGMGGANAASTRDATAQWHNPAAFGFMGQEQWASNRVDNANLAAQDFSMEVFGIGLGATATENMGRYLDVLADISFDTLEKGTLGGDGNNVKSMVALAGIIGSIESSDALYADLSTGIGMQMGRWGIGLRLFGEGTAFAIPDRENLSLNTFINSGEVAAEINTAAANDGFNGAAYTFQVLNTAQQNELGTTLGVAGTSDTIKYLDSKFAELAAAGDLANEEVSQAIDTFADLMPGGNSIEANQTAVVGRGFLVAEIPVSFGYALNESLSFGITAKAMYGTVLGTKIWIFDDNNDLVFEDLSDNYNGSLNFGLDLGVLYRIPKFQFALVGHNLNSPTFSGFTDTVSLNGTPDTVDIPDVRIDPQITFGAAFIPSQRLTLEANLDLLETGTLLDSYDIQRLSFGGELDVWLLALRLGAYKNLAASWQDWVATAGLGANIFGVRADIGGAFSLGNSVEYGGTDIPSEARLYAGIGLDF